MTDAAVARHRRRGVRRGSAGAALLHRRGRRLLTDMLGGKRGRWPRLRLVVIASLAALAGPWLVGLGIDQGIPPLVASRDAGPLLGLAAAFGAAITVQAVATRAFISRSAGSASTSCWPAPAPVRALPAAVGAFHEDYTSGRVISRQTNDIDAISALFEDGLDSLVSAVLSLVLVGAGMLLLDWPLGLVVLAGFGPLVCADRVVPPRVGDRLPARPGGHRAGDRASSSRR